MTSRQSQEYKYFFEVATPLGFTVRTTQTYWNKIAAKHPDIADRVEDVKKTLQAPMEIRRSSQDELVFLFYSLDEKYWLTVVTKQARQEGFLITCYRSEKVKEGEKIWPK